MNLLAWCPQWNKLHIHSYISLLSNLHWISAGKSFSNLIILNQVSIAFPSPMNHLEKVRNIVLNDMWVSIIAGVCGNFSLKKENVIFQSNIVIIFPHIKQKQPLDCVGCWTVWSIKGLCMKVIANTKIIPLNQMVRCRLSYGPLMTSTDVDFVGNQFE